MPCEDYILNLNNFRSRIIADMAQFEKDQEKVAPALTHSRTTQKIAPTQNIAPDDSHRKPLITEIS